MLEDLQTRLQLYRALATEPQGAKTLAERVAECEYRLCALAQALAQSTELAIASIQSIQAANSADD